MKHLKRSRKRSREKERYILASWWFKTCIPKMIRVRAQDQLSDIQFWLLRVFAHEQANGETERCNNLSSAMKEEDCPEVLYVVIQPTCKQRNTYTYIEFSITYFFNTGGYFRNCVSYITSVRIILRCTKIFKTLTSNQKSQLAFAFFAKNRLRNWH